MPARIRFARWGRRNRPFFRLVVAEREKPRDGRYIEVLGTYDPWKETGKLTAKRDRLEHWLQRGAVPSQTVKELLKTLR